MKRKNMSRRVLSMLLVLMMVVSLTVPALAAGEEEEAAKFTWEKVDNGSAPGLKPAHKAEEPTEDAPLYADTDTVRVSIVLEKASTLEKGFATRGIADNASAMSYRDTLKAEQASIEKAISVQALGGRKLDVVWNLTLAANIISANVKFGQIESIKDVKGVKDVVIEKVYSPCVTSMGGDDPNMATSSAMIGSGIAWADGYTGAGSRIAIIDTGIDTDHQSFAESGYLYSLEQNAEKLGMSYDEYVDSLDLLTAAEVSEKWNLLNFSARYKNVANTYFSEKVPFGANYVDYGVQITHDYDNQTEHGSHVAGIASANSYIPTGDGFVPALDSVKTQGVAPDAQLIVMKVFGQNGGAYDSDYMVAIEDAIMLDADVVNLSLGSANAGASTDSTYQDILDGLVNSDTVVSISAGNAGTWADNTSAGYLYSDGGNLDMVGSPGSYTNAFTVASADNDGATGGYLLVDDEMVFYSETSGPNAPISTVTGEREFVYFDNYGADGDGNSLFTNAVADKIAVCNRGGSSFYQKMDAAANAGAIACIVVNNQPGVINMQLDDATTSIPCVSVTQDIGDLFKSASEYNGTYYAGKLTVSNGIASVNYDSEYNVMSSFSSMGVPESLQLKPEISAPGGSIYSVNGLVPGGKAYELMSGTSMAAPQVAGMTALVAQYIRENGLEEETGLSARQLAQSLLMSTAVPVIEADSGYYYPVMKQGAGLANVGKAINAGSYITMGNGANAGAADGKIKVELGDDPDRTGSYSFSFELNNMEDKDKLFDLSAAFFTQDIFQFEAGGDTYLDTWTVPLSFGISWSVDGKAISPKDMEAIKECDFNDDGNVNYKDGAALLDYLVDKTDSIANQDAADIDGSGSINSYDALLFFKALSTSVVTVPAGESVTVDVYFALNNIDNWDDCGAYVEGYVFADEHDTFEGVAGDSHSIPVFGYYGSWDESSMFDVGSYVEYDYELETRLPYMYAAAGNKALYYNTYLVSYAGESGNYYFGGNPLMYDEEYMPERNALNGEVGDKISKLNFTAIRNAAASRFAITDSKGNIISEDFLGGVDCAFYHDSSAAWMSTNYGLNIGFTGKGIAEGTQLTMALTLAPEYYVKANGGVDWASLDEACSFSMPVVIDNTAPVISDPTVVEDQLVFTASDNQYIAAIAFYDSEGNRLGLYGSDSEAEAGASSEYAFDLDENIDKYLVEVYDYALNLSTYKLNLNTEELENDVSIELSDGELELIKGSTYKLTAEVGPWGADSTVTWSSDNESVATVNANGVVTAVGEGECVITAVPAADNTKSAQCYVSVTTLHFTLDGVLQDVEGIPQTFTWDLANDNTWQPGVEIDPAIGAACRLDADTLLVMSSEGSYDTYAIDAETGETLASGVNSYGFPYWDMAASQMLNGAIYGTYGPYLFPAENPLAVDPMGYNLTSILNNYGGSNYFISIESMGCYYNEEYGIYLEEFFLLDDAGNMWCIDFDEYGSCVDEDSYFYYLGFFPTTLTDMELPGYDDFLQTNMVMADDEYGTIFFSAFNGSTNLLYMLTMYSSRTGLYFEATPIGDVGIDVWPAALTGATYDYGSPVANSNRVSLYDTMGDKTNSMSIEGLEIEKIDASTLANVASGSLNSAVVSDGLENANGKPDAGVSSLPGAHEVNDSGYVVLNVTASNAAGEDVFTNNGIITVDYDAEALELISIDVFADYYSVNGARFAYVDLNGIAAGETVATLTFKVVDSIKTNICVVTEEIGIVDGFENPGYEEEIDIACAETHDNIEVRGAVDPTCTEDGYSGDVYCLDCGTLLTEGEVLPALGHSYSDTWSSDAEEHWHAATCGHDLKKDVGSHVDDTKDHKCDVCGYTMSECVDENHDGICEYCGATVYGVYLNVTSKQNKTLLFKLNVSNTYNFTPVVFGADVKKVQYSIDGGFIWLPGSSVTLLSIDHTFHVRITDSTGAKTVFTVRDGVPTLK